MNSKDRETLERIERKLSIPVNTNAPTVEQIKDALNPGLLAIPAAVAAITLPRLITPAQVKTAAKTGVCEEAQPGGCLGKPLGNLQNTTNNNGKLLGALNTGIQTGQSALLAVLNTKLDGIGRVLGTNVIPGGISGGFSKFTSWAVVDRVINLITLAGVIHNITMLSTSIQESFFSILDNIFTIPNLIKNPNGEAFDSKAVIGKEIDYFFKGLLGIEEWNAIKAQYKAYSTIYNTGAQVFGNVRDIFEETNQINHITSNWVAELGNGLTDEGIISEDNWDYKDPDQKPKGKYFGRLQNIADGVEKVENVFEDLEQVTGSVRSIVETANEIKENTTAINKAIADANKAAKADRDAKEEGLEIPNFSVEDLF